MTSENVYLFTDSGQTETVRQELVSTVIVQFPCPKHTIAAPLWALRSNLFNNFLEANLVTVYAWAWRIVTPDCTDNGGSHVARQLDRDATDKFWANEEARFVYKANLSGSGFARCF